MTPEVKQKYLKMVSDNLEKGDIALIAKKTGYKYMTAYSQVKGRCMASREIIEATIEVIKEKKRNTHELIKLMEV